MKKLVYILIFLTALNLFAGYDYYDEDENEKTFELGGFYGLSFIQGDKSTYWDSGFNLGLGSRYNINENILISLDIGYAIWYPVNQDVDREYNYEIFPLTFSGHYKLGNFNEYKIYGGLGVSYVSGNLQVDQSVDSESSDSYRIIEYNYGTNGYAITPSLLVRVPFGDHVFLDVLAMYRYLEMESRNSINLSLDHLNFNGGLYISF